MKKEINVEGKEFNEIMLELGYVPKFVIRISDGEILIRNSNGSYSFDRKDSSKYILHEYHYDITKKISDEKNFKVTHWIENDIDEAT